MQASTLRALEFDRIREILAQHAATPLGRERALELEPATEFAEVAAGLALTTEGVQFANASGSLGLWAPDDLGTTLETLSVEGQILEPADLVSLARFVDSVDGVVSGIRRTGDDQTTRDPVSQPYPKLYALIREARPFPQEVAAVRRAIDATGEVNDDASPALRDIRERLRRQRAKLRSTLETLSKGRDTAKYLQDQIVTDRNGRYVLVVRSEHRESIPGIVHGSSASGASLYLEPLATVELNNETVTLSEKEKAEVYRILLALTDGFRRRDEDLATLLRVAADIDELYAKVDFARQLDGIAPALSPDGRLEFRGARHPLLVVKTSGVNSPSKKAVSDEMTPDVFAIASDLLIQPPNKALVISGPNTGGKTVALKAFGLLAVMAQAGLLIPVERGSVFTPLKSVFADIGDDQSISASLSTFSAHIAHLVEMERALELPALVLLDEVGSGTDPVEGGALGTAVIDHFLRRGAMIVATTHDDALKSYAATTSGVAAAAFGFIAETYAPTYRLVYGAPGRSLAMEIAERLGMPAAVIADARARRSGRESQLAAHLDRVDKELAVLDQEKTATRKERELLMAERTSLNEREARLAEREAVLKRRMDDKLNERLREARAEVDKVVADLKAKAQHVAGQAESRLRDGRSISTGDIGELRAEARSSLEAIGSSIEGAPAPDPRDEAPSTIPANGATVFVTSFGVDGIVRGGSGKNVDVEIRGKRMRVALKDIRTRRPTSNVQGAGSAPGSTDGRPKAKTPILPGSTGGGSTALSPVSMELMVIGQTVDQAIDKAEKFLDDALLKDARVLRIVHGHGTGKLRDAIREFFKRHPLVADVSAAPDNQGGGGATIITLKD
ncbi:MAG: Smr/MutS family protein [Acidobacteria bacterium]|nr:Smr/MutS family protein [Acidobacteriota bacterium]MBP8274449.1 Smr/MutS family protein [Acidobacteriota bacterium]